MRLPGDTLLSTPPEYFADSGMWVSGLDKDPVCGDVVAEGGHEGFEE